MVLEVEGRDREAIEVKFGLVGCVECPGGTDGKATGMWWVWCCRYCMLVLM